MEEEKELKPEEAVKVKEIILIKPEPPKDNIRWLIRLKTDTGENRIVKITPDDIVSIGGDFKVRGHISPGGIFLTFKEPVPGAVIGGFLRLGDKAIEDVMWNPCLYGFRSIDEARRFLEEKKLLESI